MKLGRTILVGLSVTLGLGAVGAFAQTLTRGGAALAPRLNPFAPDATLSGSGWKVGDQLPIDERLSPAPTPFTPPPAIRPPFFPSPRSPYFPGPR